VRTIAGNRWMPFTCRRPKAEKAASSDEEARGVTYPCVARRTFRHGKDSAGGGEAKAKRGSGAVPGEFFRCHLNRARMGESAAFEQSRRRDTVHGEAGVLREAIEK
jgi:hypothetical protein